MRSESLRSFWLRESVTPVEEGRSSGDRIVHEGITYHAVEVHDWTEFREVVGVATE